MIHYFTFGEGSKRGVFLTTAQAEAFNRFTRSFLDAQTHFREEHGRRWTPNEPIYMPFGGKDQLRDNDELDVYHQLIPFLERQYWIRTHVLRRPITEKHMTGDYLVKKF